MLYRSIYIPKSEHKLIFYILCAKIGILFDGGDGFGRKERVLGAFDPMER